MSALHWSWLEIAVLAPLIGALWISRFRDPVPAFRWCLGFAGITLVCTIGAWIDFESMSSAVVADDRWDLTHYLFGRPLLVIDELSAQLLPLVALVFFLIRVATARTKMRRFSFAGSLVSESLVLATFAAKEPWLVIALMALSTLPPYLELVARGRPTRVYALHMGLFVILMIAGQLAVDAEGDRVVHSWGATALLLAAVLLRCGICPVHCWLTDLFEHATFGTALLFVAPLTGAYAAVRLVLPIAPEGILQLMGVLSLVTAVYAAGMAMVQREARRFFAYLFLSHSSLVLVGLELATPMSLTTGIGLGAQNGILIRSGDALQAAEKLNAIILDKTGTITKGKPELTDVVVADGTWLAAESDQRSAVSQSLRLAASVEKSSEHPLALAIVEGAQARHMKLSDVQTFEAIPGHGVSATVEGRRVLIGNLRLMSREGIALGELEEKSRALADDGKTPMYVAIDGQAAGILAVADTVKEDSRAAIVAMKKMGLEVVMITGDNERTARAIARQVGVERVLAEVLPQDKAFNVQKLQLEGKKVAMVGDGINDAPALAQADIGLAIGTGTDVAIEASDITLIKGSLMGVVTAIQLSRATMRNVYQNLFGAFVYNTAGLPIALGVLYPFFGLLLSPLLAALAMSFSSVTVISNANRLKGWKPGR